MHDIYLPSERAPDHGEASDAVMSAIRYRRDRAARFGIPQLELLEGIDGAVAPEPVRAPNMTGWWIVGYVDDRIAGHRLLVYHHPITHRHRVARPEGEPDPPAVRIDAKQLSVTFRSKTRDWVMARFRPFCVDDWPEWVISVAVPYPESRRKEWEFGMRVIDPHHKTVEVPETFPEMTAAERRDLLIRLVHDLGLRAYDSAPMERPKSWDMDRGPLRRMLQAEAHDSA